MANITILDANGPETVVVFHIAIPNANNSAGVNYRTALVNSGIGGTTVLKSGDGTLGTISAADLAAIQAGSMYESVQTLRVGSNAASGAALTAYLTAQYAIIQPVILANLQARLLWWGASGG